MNDIHDLHRAAFARILEELSEDAPCRCPYGGRGENGCNCSDFLVDIANDLAWKEVEEYA